MTTNSDLKKLITREYERDRAQAHRLSRERKQQAFSKAPRLKELESEISAQGFALAKIVLGELDHKAVHNIRARQQALAAERDALLSDIGITKAYLEDVYKCDHCKDTGHAGNAICACFKHKLAQRFYSLSGVQKSIEKENFDTFSFEYYSRDDCGQGISPYENMLMNHAASIDFAGCFPNVAANLLLYGDAGLGKTFLCNCIAREVLNAGHLVIYVTAPQLFRKIENKRFGGDNAEFSDTQLDLIYDADLLIIDDLGSEFGTVVTRAELFNILNSRLLERLPMVISTNLSFENFRDTYSDRVYSRVLGGFKLLEIFGDDIRELKKRGKR